MFVSELMDDFLDKLAKPLPRPIVRNREPRVPFEPIKRALIYTRDGARCRICGSNTPNLALDHVTPRSSYLPGDVLAIADRSDNLQALCHPCNERKSNREYGMRPPPGVTRECRDCALPSGAAPGDVLAYCGTCNTISVVPDTSWLL